MTDAPTVFVIDDNPGIRRSLRALLESVGLRVETYAAADEFLDAYDAERTGCLVLDVRLKRANGLELQDELRRRKALIPIIVLTGHGNVPMSVRALRAGAVDFLQKPVAPAVLVERVHAAIETDRLARAAVTERANVGARLGHLTPRERQVLDLLVDGKTSKEIAAALGLSVRTVEGYRRMVLLKMDVGSAAQLVRNVLIARKPRG